jgi:uncharacterized cofD-like protein
MSERVGALSEVDELFSSLTGAKLEGKVIPVSASPANICFKTISGVEYCGENYLDSLRMSSDIVKEIWLSPKVSAEGMAIKAINEAEIIIICPGSMYGSVITNFLAKGMKEAYNISKAVKVLMTNIMSVANENDGFSQNDYVEIFKKYLDIDKPFDVILMADLLKINKVDLKKTLANYSFEHSRPIRFEEKITPNYKVVSADIAVIDKSNFRLRHSVSKLAKLFAKMDICRSGN